MRRTTSTKCRRPGLGLLIAGLLLLAVELWLHTDGFLHRYRSVFAAGRALDKTMHVEAHCPNLLIIGNSRVDNGFDPITVTSGLELPVRQGIFNLGIPGADARVLAGIVDRVDASGCLQVDGVRYVVLSLDEAIVQSIDSLGQEVFFGNVAHMLADGQYLDALRATFRLYGYTTNLRQLREPGTLRRFVRATIGDVEPVGGGAAAHLGYRAGIGSLQDADAALRQEAGSIQSPTAANLRHLWRMLDLFDSRGVRVVVVFPPLLNRDVLYLAKPAPTSSPYLAIVEELRRRDVPLITLDSGPPRDPAEFVNPGHLNDKGAQRYSVLLTQALNGIWGSGPPALSGVGRRAEKS
jgi:hypothetical protein